MPGMFEPYTASGVEQFAAPAMADHSRMLEETCPIGVIRMVVSVDDVPDGYTVPLLNKLSNLARLDWKWKGVNDNGTHGGDNSSCCYLSIELTGEDKDMVCYPLTEHGIWILMVGLVQWPLGKRSGPPLS